MGVQLVMVYHACTDTASHPGQSQGYYHRGHSSMAWCCRLCLSLYQSLVCHNAHSRDKMQFWMAVTGWSEVFIMNSAKAGSRPSLTLSSSDRTSSLARTDITSPFFSSFVSYSLKMSFLLNLDSMCEGFLFKIYLNISSTTL